MRFFSLVLGLLLLTAAQRVTAQEKDTDLATSARLIAQKSLIVDTHIDVPYRLHGAWADVTVATPDGDFDYERARQGGLDVLFMSIYTPAEMEATGGSFQLANELIDNSEALVGRAPDKFMMVHSTADALAHRR